MISNPQINKTRGANSGKVSGATCFFRNRPLLETISSILQSSEDLSVLFHACSVGPEVYSFAINAALEKNFSRKFSIYATDFEQLYLDKAKKGIYSSEDISHLSDTEKMYFTRIDNNRYQINKSIQEMITFLPPSDYRVYESEKKYDIVFLLNSLCYVTAEEQSKVINKISSYNDKYLIISAFHTLSIKQDIKRNGYSPVLANIEEIYNSWPFQIAKKPSLLKRYIKNLLPAYKNSGTILSGAELFSKNKDYEYKYCSIFVKDSFIQK